MEIEVTAQDVIEWISEALRAEHKIEDEVCTFHFTRPEVEKCIELSDIEDILHRLSTKEKIEETGLYDTRLYEVLVKEVAPFFRPFRPREQEFVLRDEENRITYKLSLPSDEYLIFLLYEVSKIAAPRFLMSFGGIVSRILERDGDCNILTLLKSTTSRFLTLQVESEQDKTASDFLKYANSFFFHLSYNVDRALVPRRYLDELVRGGRISRVRRTSFENLEAPKRFYTPDLIYHYLMAVGSDSPPLECLSYYHVAEHFFEAVFSDDLIERVKDTITQPDFSYKRKRDIKRLINQVGRSLKFRGETMTFSELEALRLTLERYVNLSVLVGKLREYDDSLIEYYRTNQVPFCNGPCVDLESNDARQSIVILAKRISQTRNAIVHSKESEKGKYFPFEHDKLLSKEVPLLRFTAELIIIESSNVIS